MEQFLTALTSAATSVGSLFVSFFKSLSEAFLDTSGTTPTITFVGGILVVGLVVMIAFMILRWIISLVKGV